MRAFFRSLAVTAVALLAAVTLAIGNVIPTVTLTATTALIMGGTGRPDPDDFPGYVPNVAQYYIYPNSMCQPPGCDLDGVYTPETAWPVYGGPDAPTWKRSVLEGTELFAEAVDEQLETLGPDDDLVLFGYSQSGAILAYQKAALADLTDDQKEQIEFVVIGDVSRPNGGLNSRFRGLSIPIVEFPFGPPMPTDTGIETTDIAMKWDIIADAPLYVTNPLAMLNALLGFEYVHGTYPYPTAATPDRTPGGYTVQQWQWLMDHPELYPELVDVQEYGDTEYITVTPTVLPLVAPLHGLGLKPVADLIEPALRVLIEQTGYNRDIPFGQNTGFRLIPLFDPIRLAVDLAEAVPQGITQMVDGLQGKPTWVVPEPPETLLDKDSEESEPLPEAALARPVSTKDDADLVEDTDEVEDVDVDVDVDVDEGVDGGEKDAGKTEPTRDPFRTFEQGLRDVTDHFTKALLPRGTDKASDKDPDEKSEKVDDTEKPDRDKGTDTDSGTADAADAA